MRIAIVHDDFIQEGGAEKVVEAMLEIWPQADLFTSLASKRWLEKFVKVIPPEENPSGLGSPTRRVGESGGSHRVRTSFMQSLPFKEMLYRQYAAFYPLAFESFNFSGYDVVISSSARFAHGVITSPKTLHICYIHSVPRMWWEPDGYFKRGEDPSPPRKTLRVWDFKPEGLRNRRAENLGGGWKESILSPALGYLRIWDWTAAQRVDCFVANSQYTAARVKKFYRREAEVIYPFVDLEKFRLTQTKGKEEKDVAGPFLVVSRLVRWKRIDLAIEACLQVGANLKIIGEGPDMARLKKLAARSPAVEFLGRLSDSDVISCISGARALLFPQCEDLGMTLLEALAAGTPVVAFKGGGALETMIPGETGAFFYPQTAEALAQELTSFEPHRYDSSNCRRRACRFSKAVFLRKFESFVAAQYATLRAN